MSFPSFYVPEREGGSDCARFLHDKSMSQVEAVPLNSVPCIMSLSTSCKKKTKEQPGVREAFLLGRGD